MNNDWKEVGQTVRFSAWDVIGGSIKLHIWNSVVNSVRIPVWDSIGVEPVWDETLEATDE